ncbi:MAG: DUF2953 domain-containing protein [Bacillota bacterium]
MIIKFRTFFGLVQFKYEVPIVKWMFSPQQENKVKLALNTEVESSQSQLIDEKKSLLNIHEIQDIQQRFSQYYHQFNPTIHYFLSKTEMKSLNWKTKLGFENAAVTGILSGMLWTFKGMIISIISNHIRNSENISLHIEPCFDAEDFQMSFDCIFRIKVGHIIIAAIKGFYNYFTIRGDEKNGRSSY